MLYLWFVAASEVLRRAIDRFLPGDGERGLVVSLPPSFPVSLSLCVILCLLSPPLSLSICPLIRRRSFYCLGRGPSMRLLLVKPIHSHHLSPFFLSPIPLRVAANRSCGILRGPTADEGGGCGLQERPKRYPFRGPPSGGPSRCCNLQGFPCCSAEIPGFHSEIIRQH